MSLSLGYDKEWGVFSLSLTSNVKGQIGRKKFLSKNLRNFDLLGALEIRGYKKLRFLLQNDDDDDDDDDDNELTWRGIKS